MAGTTHGIMECTEVVGLVGIIHGMVAITDGVILITEVMVSMEIIIIRKTEEARAEERTIRLQPGQGLRRMVVKEY